MNHNKAVIPSYVARNSKLTPMAKMIYAELTTLINDKGTAENIDMYYFIKAFGKSPKIIRNALRVLEDNVLIEVLEADIRLILDQLEINHIIENRGE